MSLIAPSRQPPIHNRPFLADYYLNPITRRTSQPVQLGHHEGVTGSVTGGERFSKAGMFAVGSGQPVVDVDVFSTDAQSEQGLALSGEVLGIGRTSRVPASQRLAPPPPAGISPGGSYETTRRE